MINVAILLLARLRSRRLEGYSELRAFAKKAVAGGDTLFLPSLNFLFLLGLVEYRPKTDAIEYLGPQ
ncbi:ABC-three component system middle component 8 [Brevundimonas sp. UBA7664]|uniref:ABC-three component system middle component 8 n=1 Tax=unclassified Brevundimonas TaxID=2622653 RepID=UPI0025C28B2C|nr:ABC-three component system middle component 8 [Brevundimonas sp. UBA7664]